MWPLFSESIFGCANLSVCTFKIIIRINNRSYPVFRTSNTISPFSGFLFAISKLGLETRFCALSLNNIQNREVINNGKRFFIFYTKFFKSQFVTPFQVSTYLSITANVLQLPEGRGFYHKT
jgi:hypothetical protein